MPYRNAIGDVFLLPTTQNKFAVGQIVSKWDEELYLVIFRPEIVDVDLDLEYLLTMQPALCVLSLDGKIWHGDWKLVGNSIERLDKFPQPAYKVGENGILYVESRDRKIHRPASDDELKLLSYRSIFSPASVERAVRAYFGAEEWRADFDKMLLANVEKAASVLGSV